MSTTSRDLVIHAYQNQDSLNKKLNENWATQDWNYPRAIWTEAGEAVQHIKSWFWWKSGSFGKAMPEETIKDVRMELVDIFHFGLSLNIITVKHRSTREDWPGLQAAMMIEEYNRAETTLSSLKAISPDEVNANELLIMNLEDVVVSAIQTSWFNQRSFFTACLLAGMDLEHLLSLYFAKSTLNKFRWSNGLNLPADRPDKYIKMWPSPDGSGKKVEDNIVLQKIVTMWLADGSLLEDGIDSFDASIERSLDHYYCSFVVKRQGVEDSSLHN